MTKLAEARGAKRLTAEASDVAKPLFERLGFTAQQRNLVVWAINGSPTPPWPRPSRQPHAPDPAALMFPNPPPRPEERRRRRRVSKDVPDRTDAAPWSMLRAPDCDPGRRRLAPQHEGTALRLTLEVVIPHGQRTPLSVRHDDARRRADHRRRLLARRQAPHRARCSTGSASIMSRAAIQAPTRSTPNSSSRSPPGAPASAPSA